MMKMVVVALISLTLVMPAFGKAHKDSYPVPCGELWAAVKDTLSNPTYIVASTDDKQMRASYSIGGFIRHATNAVALNSQGASSCEMEVQSTYRGWMHDDAGDFKTRVEASLAKLKAAKPSESAGTATETKQ
jgi:hypothetical protein